MDKNIIEKLSPEKILQFILDKGINGAGSFKGAQRIADEALNHAGGNVDKAVARVIKTHTTLVGTSGFVSGLGGFATMPVSIPADVTVFYANAARMVAAIAFLRGYDIRSEEVRTAVSVSFVGVIGSEAMAKIGIDVARRGGMAALKKLPGRVLIEINKKVGFRLFTKMGTTGSINLVKFVPVLASGVGATFNVASMRTIGGYARRNFPQVTEVVVDESDLLNDEEFIIDAEIIDDYQENN